MNISKLLKITALSCIGLFNINNSIVNASDYEFYIDDDVKDIIGNEDDILQETLNLYRANKLKAVLSVDLSDCDCKVEKFPENKKLLITNGHNVFVYYNGCVNVYYNKYHPDEESTTMKRQSLKDLKNDIFNKFGSLNFGFIEAENDKNINIPYIIHAAFGDNYELIDGNNFNEIMNLNDL